MMHPRVERSAFSLVELLVVVAIISVLAALLMPSLTQALESGRQMACVNNTRQLSLAFQSYLNCYGDVLPRYSNVQWEYWDGSYSNQYTWQYFMRYELDTAIQPNGGASSYGMNNYRYVRGSMLFCPSDPQPFTTANVAIVTSPVNGGNYPSYGMNAYGIGRAIYGLSGPKRYRRLHDLANPGRQIGFGDIYWTLYPTGGFYGNHFPYGCIRYIHNEMTSSLFCDGHVGTFTLDQIQRMNVEENLPNPASRTDYNILLTWWKCIPWGNP